jgi:hypothetical protein
VAMERGVDHLAMGEHIPVINLEAEHDSAFLFAELTLRAVESGILSSDEHIGVILNSLRHEPVSMDVVSVTLVNRLHVLGVLDPGLDNLSISPNMNHKERFLQVQLDAFTRVETTELVKVLLHIVHEVLLGGETHGLLRGLRLLILVVLGLHVLTEELEDIMLFLLEEWGTMQLTLDMMDLFDEGRVRDEANLHVVPVFEVDHLLVLVEGSSQNRRVHGDDLELGLFLREILHDSDVAVLGVDVVLLGHRLLFSPGEHLLRRHDDRSPSGQVTKHASALGTLHVARAEDRSTSLLNDHEPGLISVRLDNILEDPANVDIEHSLEAPAM